MKTIHALAAGALLATAVGQAQAAQIEVLHWWTSGGEAKAANLLKEKLEAKGHTWKDFAVAGGAGDSAMTVLKSRAISGNPPAVAQIKGPLIQEWGEMGFLGNIDKAAEADGWDDFLPQEIAAYDKVDGHYAAVPVNIHRINWIWANPEVLKASGVEEVPQTWDAFFEAADKIREAGYIPLAHGGQPWQDATVFEVVMMGIGGGDFYRKAFVELDPEALTSDTMIESLETFKKLRGTMDDNIAGRDWNIATSMVINGKAAMQIMGDWAKGEFTAAGMTPGEDYECVAPPMTEHMFSYNTDSLAMFDVDDAGQQQAQLDLASLVLSPDFQASFNQAKGSIPVRLDVPLDDFDACAKASREAFDVAMDEGGLVPSLAHGMAVSDSQQGAVFDVITNFFNDPDMTAETAAERLVSAVRAAE
ncbi:MULTISPECIES: ABC transporter substrate-binding protein [Chromohalobacter]|uniref:ABC transporter substrate-binding protein n=1 Tax=Chromohalobacter TaxID=42054 RepID=UPI0005566291|nr:MULTISPECIES: ABC transporter substrate-binding protein [Chromohalobacter]MBZ5877706.1 ABC transporter substrate-binding protein [Chromohalobacter salexigens]MDF9435828.1 ABC transporter substrate-binding protein [Chromohalobacter israelensis]NWO57004.1 carbohydrate ABC transporter substrate-binding protein [Chromohalobacter salexigens]PWW31628.1 carbohydrate ABC transporter substrate-binding protein (CUT1 family) [Chromohalobacter salexigens]RXE48842.1 sugar ABC transporter substrate-bindi